MKLYLSSFGLGNQPERLLSLVGSRKRIALILNALDNLKGTRDKFLASQTTLLSSLGFSVQELDLRNYFGAAGGLHGLLATNDAVWICGGNAFILRRAMRQSTFDFRILKFLRSDTIVCAGFSAAVCCAAPTLRGTEMVDDPHTIPPEYDREIIWEGLGLIDYNGAVHYKSAHSEAAAIEKMVQYYDDHDITYRTLSDGQAIVVNGDKTELLL